MNPLSKYAPARMWLPALAGLGLALIVRHVVVEPTAIAHGCDLDPWAGWCAPRTVLIHSFVQQRIGWLAFAAGVASIVIRRSSRWQPL